MENSLSVRRERALLRADLHLMHYRMRRLDVRHPARAAAFLEFQQIQSRLEEIERLLDRPRRKATAGSVLIVKDLGAPPAAEATCSDASVTLVGEAVVINEAAPNGAAARTRTRAKDGGNRAILRPFTIETPFDEDGSPPIPAYRVPPPLRRHVTLSRMAIGLSAAGRGAARSAAYVFSSIADRASGTLHYGMRRASAGLKIAFALVSAGVAAMAHGIASAISSIARPIGGALHTGLRKASASIFAGFGLLARHAVYLVSGVADGACRWLQQAGRLSAAGVKSLMHGASYLSWRTSAVLREIPWRVSDQAGRLGERTGRALKDGHRRASNALGRTSASISAGSGVLARRLAYVGGSTANRVGQAVRESRRRAALLISAGLKALTLGLSRLGAWLSAAKRDSTRRVAPVVTGAAEHIGRALRNGRLHAAAGLKRASALIAVGLAALARRVQRARLANRLFAVRRHGQRWTASVLSSAAKGLGRALALISAGFESLANRFERARLPDRISAAWRDVSRRLAGAVARATRGFDQPLRAASRSIAARFAADGHKAGTFAPKDQNPARG